MPLQVAELSTLFTGNIDDVEAKTKAVVAMRDDVDGSKAQVELTADASKAAKTVTTLEGELKTATKARTVPISIDASKFEQELPKTTASLDAAGEEWDLAAVKHTAKVNKKMGAFVGDTAQQFAQLGPALSGAMEGGSAGALSSVSTLAMLLPGPIGLIGGILGGLAAPIIDSFAKAKVESEKIVAAFLADMEASGKHFLTSMDIDAEAKKIVEGVDGAIASLSDAKQIAADAGLSAGTVVRALAGDMDYQSRVSAALAVNQQKARDAWQAWISTHKDAKTYPKELADAVTEADWAVDKFNQKVGVESAAVSDSSDKLSILNDAVGEHTKNADYAASADDRVKEAVQALTDAQAELKQKVVDANNALEDQGNNGRSAAHAENDLKDQIKQTTETLTEKDKKTHKLKATESERRDALVDLADKIAGAAAAEEAASGKTQSWNDTIAANRKAFIDAAGQMGITGAAAEALADKYGLIPKTIDTTATLTVTADFSDYDAAVRSHRTGSGPQKFAKGGRPPVGQPSIVGEEGIELWIPDTAGTIVPHAQTMQALANGNPAAGGQALPAYFTDAQVQILAAAFRDGAHVSATKAIRQAIR